MQTCNLSAALFHLCWLQHFSCVRVIASEAGHTNVVFFAIVHLTCQAAPNILPVRVFLRSMTCECFAAAVDPSKEDCRPRAVSYHHPTTQ